ncbi:MAG TPA: helix-turn-helix transcriptional regulator [Longimicrobiales bacterium]|nr:helix-turn-helix transcriptional regulator [Longimicrobiales bacterium]
MNEANMKQHWFHILLSLADQRLHGSAIMEEVLERTEGGMKLWPGMLYGSLAELAERGWIREAEAPADAPAEGGRRRFWSITRAGRRELRSEVERLESYVRAAREKRVVGGASRA